MAKKNGGLVTFCDLIVTNSLEETEGTCDDDPLAPDEALDCIDDPKPLGDCFEALVAAVYLDSGLNLNRVWIVFSPFLEKIILQ